MIEIIVVEKEVHSPIGNCKHLVIILVITLVIITISWNPPILTNGSSTYLTLLNQSSAVLTSKGSQFCCSP